MDEDQAAEAPFDIEKVCNIIKESVEIVLGSKLYQHDSVNQCTASVLDLCLTRLSSLGKPVKYIVTCIITERNGAGLQIASTCFWDVSTDGSCSVKWENETMVCNVHVFGLAI